jgi:teichuronic acid biosynthesis glycosyltransferase TuaG
MEESNDLDISKLVSIITPAYKAASYIMQAIRSVQGQTYPMWEMLIVDDCSPDNTCDVVEQASIDDPRIRLIKLELNSGPANARNAALEQARGRWIAFLDSDDLWLPTKLEISLAYAASNNVAFLHTGYRRITLDGKLTGEYIKPPALLSYRQLLGNTAIATSTVMVDIDLCGEIKMRKAYYDDFVCWLEITKRGIVAHGLDIDLMRYRVVPNSVSRNKIKSALEVWKTYREIEKLSFIYSAWHLINYATRALIKYRKF